MQRTGPGGWGRQAKLLCCLCLGVLTAGSLTPGRSKGGCAVPEEKLGGQERVSPCGHRPWSHAMTRQAPCVTVPSLEPGWKERLSCTLLYPSTEAGLMDTGNGQAPLPPLAS